MTLPLTAKDLMTPTTQTVSDDLDINELVKILREKRIGGLPVMNSKGKLSGVVSVYDTFKAMEIVRAMAHGKLVWYSKFNSGKEVIKVKDIYERTKVRVFLTTPLEEVVDAMLSNNLHTLPVFDEAKDIFCGVIGRHDLTWAVFGDNPPSGI